jgi:serine/threonine protein kinase
MPAPASVDELIALVSKSRVVDEKSLQDYLRQLRNGKSLPNSAGQLATSLIRAGLLSHFQAEQLMQGKWRGFFIGRYRVLEQLGAGGMGNVYLGEHAHMHRLVAIKVLPATLAKNPSALERFYREARAGAALDHPNIIRSYDIDKDERLHFMAMEYVDGASLQEIVKRHGPLTPLRAAHYTRQAALGLQHAHESGLVHRDIKPGNLLLDRAGTVKILDMGLARFLNDHTDNLTRKYDENVLGTADYFSPEQAVDSHTVDIRADIYSLGATFYFLLTGHAPFEEASMVQKLLYHQTKQPKSIKTFRPDVPDGILALIDQMMAKDPAKRPQRPVNVAEALQPFTRTPIPPPSDQEMPRLSPMVQRAVQSQAKETPAPSASSTSTPPPTNRAAATINRPRQSSSSINIPAMPMPRPVNTPARPAAAPRPTRQQREALAWASWRPSNKVLIGLGVALLVFLILIVVVIVWAVSGRRANVVGPSTATGTAPATAVGLLKISQAPAPKQVDLTAEGTIDWLHWGHGGTDNLNRKKDVQLQLSTWTRTGAGKIEKFDKFPVQFVWKDGFPTTNSTSNASGVFAEKVGNGFEFSLPADTTLKTLRVYVRAFKCTGKFEAKLSDSSASEASNTISNKEDGTSQTEMIHFRAKSPGQKLNVKFTMTEDFGGGNVSMQAETLSLAPADVN